MTSLRCLSVMAMSRCHMRSGMCQVMRHTTAASHYGNSNIIQRNYPILKSRSVNSNNNYVGIRWASSSPKIEVTFEELKALLTSGTAQLIDVREPKEIQELGYIPRSINIPLGEVKEALDLEDNKFRDRFGVERPSEEIVFHCMAGVRSLKALNMAKELGYDKARHFPGGYEEWVKRTSKK